MKRSAIASVVVVSLIGLLGATLAPAMGASLETKASASMAPVKVAPVKVAKIICKATKAKGHTPKKMALPAKMTPGKMGKFTLVTNCGNIVIRTNGVKAPMTMTVLTALAKGGYFNASLCHRLTTQGLYVLQCGDPSATGTGGPGFAYKDENLPAQVVNNYPAGTVAMANSGPSTNGSQFFLVFGNTSLGASYTIWGKIIAGLDIVKAVAKAGVKGGGADGTPAQTIAIEKVIIS